MENFDYKLYFHKIAYRIFIQNGCDSIFDIGCGKGKFIKLDPEKIAGLDGNPDTVKYCQNKGYKVSKNILPRIDCENNKYNGVYVSHLIEHFLPKDLHELLKEVDRILKPGGVLIVFTPLHFKGFYNTMSHIKPYNPKAIINFFTSNKKRQSTFNTIGASYEILDLIYRYQTIRFFTNIVYKISGVRFLNYFHKTGYLIALKKASYE